MVGLSSYNFQIVLSDVTDSKSQQGTSLVCCILTPKGKDIQSNSPKWALCCPSPSLLEIALLFLQYQYRYCMSYFSADLLHAQMKQLEILQTVSCGSTF